MIEKKLVFSQQGLLVITLLFVPLLSGYAQYNPPTDPNYQLSTTYSDEFNGTYKSRWQPLNSFDHLADGIFESGEIHFNTETVAGQTKNYLELTGTRKIDSNSNYYYATGGLKVPSYNSSYFYGYYEVEARLSIAGSKSTTQLFPAFWIWNANNTPSWYQEMDIFEAKPEYVRTDLQNVHYYYRRPGYPNSQLFSQEGFKPGIDMTAWHTYGLEWNVDKLIFYVDGAPFYTVLPDPSIDLVIPSHGNMFLLVDLQVQRVGPTLDFTSSFLGSMDVNYFRYYTLKKSSSCSTLSLYTISSNTDLTNYLNPSNNLINLKKTITIGSSSAISVPNSTTVIMRATDGFTINGDFTVPLGSELNLIPTVCY